MLNKEELKELSKEVPRIVNYLASTLIDLTQDLDKVSEEYDNMRCKIIAMEFMLMVFNFESNFDENPLEALAVYTGKSNLHGEIVRMIKEEFKKC